MSCASPDDPPPPAAAVTQAGGFAVSVELDDPAFLGDEVRRLEKHLGGLEKDLAFVAKKLDNPKFMERAKPEVVEAEQEKHASLDEELRAVRERLERLRALVA